MTYQFRWRHVSQLRQTPSGLSGENDCAEASVSRYLRESGFPWQGDDLSLVAHVRERMTGQAERLGQGYTTVAQLTGYLEAAGLPYRVDTDPAGILTPWTVALVRGVRLAPAQYPPLWFGGIDWPDHFVLQLPDGLTNDPLAFANGQQDCTYSPGALQAAMADGICYHLPDPATVIWNGTAAAIAVPQTLTGYRFTRDQMLRATPAVLPAVGPLVAAGMQATLAGVQAPWGNHTTHWVRVKTQSNLVGWAHLDNVSPVYSS